MIAFPTGLSRQACLGALLLLLGVGAADPAEAELSPGWAATSSLLLPGLGQARNGEPGKGALHLGFAYANLSEASRLAQKDDYLEFDQHVDENNQVFYLNRTTYYSHLHARLWLNTHFFSAYDAYRTRRMQVGGAGYNTPVPEQGLSGLALAPFNPKYLVRPTTFLPLLLPLYSLTHPSEDGWVTVTDSSIGRREMAGMNVVQYGSVAVGEEAYFRGVVNTDLSDRWGPWWGLVASSILFGAAHSGAAGTADYGMATGYGAYLGWLQQRNDYQLGEVVALHFWWDFLIGLNYLMRPDERGDQDRPIDTRRFQLMSVGFQF
jgi:hypothetical protein